MGQLESSRGPVNNTHTHITMNKWLFVLVVSLATFAHALEEEDLDDVGDARLGFITVTGNGGTSIAFNATSIQNAVILGLFLLVLGALLLPLLGLNLFGGEESSGYGYGYEQSGYSSAGSGYEQPSSSYGHGFAKRSLAMLSPVLEALSAGQKKYEEE